MTNARAEAMIASLGRNVRALMLTRFSSTCCIGTARALTRALERLGIESRTRAVSLKIFSRRFVEAANSEGVPRDPAHFPAWCATHGAWSVGAGPGGVPDGGGLDGHAVVVVPKFDILIDGSLGQFARPGRDLPLPGALAAQLTRREWTSFEGFEPLLVQIQGATAIYRRVRGLDAGIVTAPDWQDLTRTDEIVRQLVHLAKKEGRNHDR